LLATLSGTLFERLSERWSATPARRALPAHVSNVMIWIDVLVPGNQTGGPAVRQEVGRQVPMTRPAGGTSCRAPLDDGVE
jgi:hypothetical protein